MPAAWGQTADWPADKGEGEGEGEEMTAAGRATTVSEPTGEGDEDDVTVSVASVARCAAGANAACSDEMFEARVGVCSNVAGTKSAAFPRVSASPKMTLSRPPTTSPP
ncbi:MAG: hypothetical protein ABJA82_08275 [Myxococcales bacterium]